MSVFQWIGSNNADLGNGANWVDTTEPGMGQPPGPNDVAIIQVGQGLYGTLNVAGLDIVQASGAPSISITGSSTQVTAASVSIGLGFTLDTGAYLQAGTLGIDGDGTAVTVQNNALLYDMAGLNDVLTIGNSTGNASVLLTKGGTMYYTSQAASGTLNLGGVSNSTATMTISAGGYFSSALSSVNIGAASGASGILNVTGAGSQFLIDNYGYTTIGDFGELGGSAQGTVQVTSGAYASLSSYGEVDIGTSAGMAKVLVSGANSDIEAGPYVEIGLNGTNIAGEILVQTGGEFDAATDTYLNNGTISVTGANSLYTGRFLVTEEGTTVQVGTGGLIHVADLELGGTMALTAGNVNVRTTLTLLGGGEMTGSGTISAASIANAGQINASGGTLVVAGAQSGAGMLSAASGAVIELTSGGPLTQSISGAGTLQLHGATYSVSGKNITIGTVKVDAGAGLSGNGTLTGALLDSGVVTASGATLLVDGALSGAGTISASTNQEIELAKGGTFAGAITGAGKVILAGATTLGAGAQLSTSSLIAEANVTLASASVTNTAADRFVLYASTGATVTLAATGTGALTNLGTLVAEEPGTAVVSAPITNAGTISAQLGTFSFLSDVAGKGTIDLSATGTLSLELGTGSGQVVDFLATTGVMDLFNPLDFAGTITGFHGSDQIFLENTTFTADTYANNILTVSDNGTTVASLHFTGSSNAFSLTSETHGVLITFT